MKAPSRQFESVVSAFHSNDWQCEVIDGQEVLQTMFEAHHTRVHVLAQVYVPISCLSIVGETQINFDPIFHPYILELLMRANKQLTMGSFEIDMDRGVLVCRITNLFDREVFDKDIISSMVHCVIAEIDRITPYLTVITQTPSDLLEELSIERLLMREDLIPPVPGEDEDDPLI